LVVPHIRRYATKLRSSSFAQWRLEKPGGKLSHESRTMFGAHRRGFDWKEIAEVLHITRAVARATFWREIKRSRSKSVEAQPPAIVIQGESDSDTLKPGKPRASR